MLEPLTENILYESIASIEARSGCHVTPLGVYARSPTTLEAWIYPGTRLYNATLGDCVVIVFPSDPLDYARVILGEYRESDLGYCCPITTYKPYIVIEALIVAHSVEPDGRIHIVFQPVSFHLHHPPRPFSRLDSCLIEILIAYTRIRHYTECDHKLREYKSIERCLDLLERRAEGAHRSIYVVVKNRIEDELVSCRGWVKPESTCCGRRSGFRGNTLYA